MTTRDRLTKSPAINRPRPIPGRVLREVSPRPSRSKPPLDFKVINITPPANGANSVHGPADEFKKTIEAGMAGLNALKIQIALWGAWIAQAQAAFNKASNAGFYAGQDIRDRLSEMSNVQERIYPLTDSIWCGFREIAERIETAEKFKVL